ncbi:MAG: Sulphatase-modifying factor protein [Bacteroidetes bacterium]|nr:Sulphatase-modifying factor protein [Bacteroidota bacterium]
MKNLLFVFILWNTASMQAQSIIKEADLVHIPNGIYQMGSTAGESNERPEHTVTIADFYIGKYEVTQLQWQQVMGNMPSAHKNCMMCPVETVTPEQIDSFLAKLNRTTGLRYRLPTEAEWEYAALGGKQSKGYRYPGGDSLDEVAWIRSNAGDTTHPVGLKKPNELGLYDMAGNAWELCRDWYDAAYYKKSPSADPVNDKKAAFRVVRGGSWRSAENRCYSKARNRNIYDHYHFGNGGFRLVLDK